MAFWIEVLNTGRIYSCGSFPDGHTPHSLMGGQMHLSHEHVDPLRYYYDSDNESFVCYPECPTPDHVFDFVDKMWKDSRTYEKMLDRVRCERNRLLAAADWIVLRSYDQGVPVPDEWQKYRQDLRDITNQSDPFNIEWPTAPNT